jgi:hypothetical protein
VCSLLLIHRCQAVPRDRSLKIVSRLTHGLDPLKYIDMHGLVVLILGTWRIESSTSISSLFKQFGMCKYCTVTARDKSRTLIYAW